jgi:hypothetical protein
MVSLGVEPVAALTEQQLGELRGIYEESFSPDFQVPFIELTEPGDLDRTLVAFAGPAPAGFAVLRLLSSVQWSFLRYFGIAAARRSQGLGRQFWHQLQRSLAQDDWPVRIVFEVEDPADAADAAERLIRDRRVDFWRACGARVLSAPGYILPDFTGSGMTEPMLLMAGGPQLTTLPEGDQLRSLVLAIYTERYRLAPEHPIVRQALASIG